MQKAKRTVRGSRGGRGGGRGRGKPVPVADELEPEPVETLQQLVQPPAEPVQPVQPGAAQQSERPEKKRKAIAGWTGCVECGSTCPPTGCLVLGAETASASGGSAASRVKVREAYYCDIGCPPGVHTKFTRSHGSVFIWHAWKETAKGLHMVKSRTVSRNVEHKRQGKDAETKGQLNCHLRDCEHDYSDCPARVLALRKLLEKLPNDGG